MGILYRRDRSRSCARACRLRRLEEVREGESEGKETTIGGLSANDHGSKLVSGTAEVELDDFYFDPTVLKGKPGVKVTLTLKNEGKVKHNFDWQQVWSGTPQAVAGFRSSPRCCSCCPRSREEPFARCRVTVVLCASSGSG